VVLILLALLIAGAEWMGHAERSRASEGSSSAAPTSARGNTLRVFAAASLSPVLPTLAERFRERTGVRVIFNFAGSNTLARQLSAAPGAADLFISANEQWMDYLDEGSRIDPSSRVTLWSNRLVLIRSGDESGRGHRLTGVSARAQLCSPDGPRISLADPEAVPAGIYAKEWLRNIPCARGNAWERVRGRLIPALDVRAALSAVESHPGLLGIVYRSDARTSSGVRVLLEAEVSRAPAIRYPAALIRGEETEHSRGRRFLRFLRNKESRRVLERHGFVPAFGRGRQEKVKP
jgi:molybdate transport system substrate-binding protein